MQGLEMVKDLAGLERELAKKLDEARLSAEQRIAAAEEEARRISTEADAQINQLTDGLKARIAKETERFGEAARNRAEAEVTRIRRQADSNMDRAVDFVLSGVMP